MKYEPLSLGRFDFAEGWMYGTIYLLRMELPNDPYVYRSVNLLAYPSLRMIRAQKWLGLSWDSPHGCSNPYCISSLDIRQHQIKETEERDEA